MSGLYGSDTAQNMPRAVTAEAIGTFFLVLISLSVAVSSSLFLAQRFAFVGVTVTALTFGLVLTALANAFGHVSGGHFNPAVSIALAVCRKFPWKYVPGYLAAQFGAAFAAVGMVWVIFHAIVGDRIQTKAMVGAVHPADGVAWWLVLLAEAVFTFFFVSVIFSVATDARSDDSSAGSSIGTALGVSILALGFVTSGGMNPARLVAAAVLSGHLPELLPSLPFYILGELVGAIAAGLLYVYFVSKGADPSEVDNPADPAQTGTED